ncbi:MAG: hypothetical protein EP341_09680 [Sphingomonadales bacterium]|nr:MAG: hypothetical protein EP341_09680 [Sphingomonadales bacterium]
MTTESDILGRPPIMKPIQRHYGRKRYEHIDNGDGTETCIIQYIGTTPKADRRNSITLPAIPLTESRRGG